LYIRNLFEEARKHEAKQKTHQAHAKKRAKLPEFIELAKQVGVMVKLSDSTASGNCAAGTKVFAEQHGMDPRSCVPATVLARFAVNGHAYQVERAIRAATERTAMELMEGVCRIG
jgi:hypothetical protein